MKIVGAKGLGGLWALKWAWQTFGLWALKWAWQTLSQSIGIDENNSQPIGFDENNTFLVHRVLIRSIHFSYNVYSSIETVGATVLGGLCALEWVWHSAETNALRRKLRNLRA